MDPNEITQAEESLLEALEQAWLCSHECRLQEEDDLSEAIDAQWKAAADWCGYNN